MKLEHVNIIGYYKESNVVYETENPKLLYFVAFENSNNNHVIEKDWVEGYNIIDGHFTLKDKNYLISCKKITKDEYVEATKGFHTPIEYL